MIPMTEKPTRKTTPHIKPRRIVGFSLSPELATEVKIEAARRGISLRQLFDELWGLYKTNKR